MYLVAILSIPFLYVLVRKRVLRRLATLLVLNEDAEAEERNVERSPSKRERRVKLEQDSVRYDSHHVPDVGGIEWTGPVVPYVPKDR